MQREIAVAYERLSDIQHDLQSGDRNESEIESIRRAYEIRRRVGDDRAGDIKHRKEFIGLASRLAARYQVVKNASESANWDEQATALAARWVSMEPVRLEALEAAGEAFMWQGLRLETAGQAARSRESMEKAVRFAERAREIAKNYSSDHNLVNAEYTFANMLLNLKQPTEALMHAQRAVGLSQQLYRTNPHNQKWRRDYEQSLSSAGIVCRALASSDPGKLPIAVRFLEHAHSLASETARQDAKNAAAKDDFIVQSHRLARALTQSRRLVAAAKLYEEAGQTVRDLIAMNPQNRRNRYLSAANQVHYGRLRLDQGHAAEAQHLLLSADVPLERALVLDPFDATLLEVRASQLELLAMAAEKLGDGAGSRLRIRHVWTCSTG